MPNHVINSVRFDSRLDEIQEFVKGENGIFDFNKITPMPPDVEASTEERTAGIPLWYIWSNQHWGTKWNCYEVEHCHYGFQFLTAWDTPKPIFIALSEKFPDVTITVDFADEDTGGHNCGTFVLKQGAVETFKQGDYVFACQLWGWEPEEEDIEDIEQ